MQGNVEVHGGRRELRDFVFTLENQRCTEGRYSTDLKSLIHTDFTCWIDFPSPGEWPESAFLRGFGAFPVGAVWSWEIVATLGGKLTPRTDQEPRFLHQSPRMLLLKCTSESSTLDISSNCWQSNEQWDVKADESCVITFQVKVSEMIHSDQQE